MSVINLQMCHQLFVGLVATFFLFFFFYGWVVSDTNTTVCNCLVSNMMQGSLIVWVASSLLSHG